MRFLTEQDVDAAYHRGYDEAKAEPWQDLKSRFLAGINGGSVILAVILGAYPVAVLIQLIR